MSEFSPGSPLNEGQTLDWRLIGGKAEFHFHPPVILTDEQVAAAKRRAEEIATAGGATLLTDADIELGPTKNNDSRD